MLSSRLVSLTHVKAAMVYCHSKDLPHTKAQVWNVLLKVKADDSGDVTPKYQAGTSKLDIA